MNPLWDLIGLKGVGKAACKAAVANAEKKFPKIYNYLESFGCKKPKFSCKCCGTTPEGGALQGSAKWPFFPKGSTKISLCHDNISSALKLDETMRHELIHASQYCMGDRPAGFDKKGSPRDCLRREAEAYCRQNPSRPAINWPLDDPDPVIQQIRKIQIDSLRKNARDSCSLSFSEQEINEVIEDVIPYDYECRDRFKGF